MKVSAEAVGALKPHRASFDALSEALGVPPEQIVHVGDREDVDVAGALAAGMRAWRLTSKKRAPTRAEQRLSRWKLDAFAPLWTDGPESSS